MKILIFFGLGILLFTACQNEANSTQEKPIKKGIKFINFEATTIDWTCQYPDKWGRIVEMNLDKEQTALLFLEKDEFNFMTSIIEPFDSGLGSFEQLSQSTAEVIKGFYEDGGHIAETESKEIMLANKKFYSFESKIFSKENRTPVVQQTLFNGLINDTTAMSIRISFNNKEDADTLKRIIESSNFGE